MPISLKLFFCLCLAIAAWLIWQAAGLIWFPSAEHLARLAHVPEGYRALAAAGDQISAIAWTVLAVVLIATAALIVFARQGWLRFVLAALIMLRYVWPIAATFSVSGLPFSRRWEIYAAAWWPSPLSFVWLGIWASVVVLMFLPNANRWFRRRAPDA